jgi:hypothetical protein
MILRVAQEGVKSLHDTKRGNSLFSLAFQGHWQEAVALLTDPSPYVRKMLALSIAHLGAREGTPELMGVATALAEDPDVQVRCATMEAGGTLAEQGGLSILERGLSDSDANVRLAALRILMDENGEQAMELRRKAVIVLDDLLWDVFSRHTYPSELTEDPRDELLDALEKIDSPESSDTLLVAVASGRVNPPYVAEILADRQDPRALIALVQDMFYQTMDYLENDSWNAEIEQKIARGLQYPFRLAWFEALLIDEEAFQLLDPSTGDAWSSRQVARLDPRTVLTEMVEAARDNRDALAYYLWPLLIVKTQRDENGEPEDPLLEAAINRLVEVDPPILVDFICGTWHELPWGWNKMWSAHKFAERLAKTATALMDALPEKERQELMTTLEDRRS